VKRVISFFILITFPTRNSTRGGALVSGGTNKNKNLNFGLMKTSIRVMLQVVEIKLMDLEILPHLALNRSTLKG
jgi:hypothetical protein